MAESGRQRDGPPVANASQPFQRLDRRVIPWVNQRVEHA